MLIALAAFAAVAAVAAAVRAAWLLHHLWHTLPRNNQDFGLV